MTAPPIESRLMVLMFTDIVGSVKLKVQLGAPVYKELAERHNAFFEAIIASTRNAEINNYTGDGFLAHFATASDAAEAGLRFQRAIITTAWEPRPLRVRVGIHVGQVTELQHAAGDTAPKLMGLAVDIAARVQSLGRPGQILLTRTAFDDARQYVREHPANGGGGDDPLELRWLAHGPYLFKGSDEPMEIFEVGAVGHAPLESPAGGNKARRAVTPGEEGLLGWRPAVGLSVPRREEWILHQKLGEGGFGEVWLGRHVRMKTDRVFKFCHDADRLRSLKRELTLFRLLREHLGDRSDIAKIHEVSLDEQPYYLESEYSEEGDLLDWSDRAGGIDAIPLETRLELVAGIADAVAAAHSVGILHKDIKPSNILITIDQEGAPRPILADFGIGVLTQRELLEKASITVTGFTETLIGGNESSRTGTRIYAPPESLAGETFTIQGDVYALGVLLYQIVTGNLRRPLAQGWEKEVEDPLLRDDIARCVAGSRDDRLGDAGEIADRLRALPKRRQARRIRRTTTRIVAASLVVLALAAIGGGVVAVRQSLETQAVRESLTKRNLYGANLSLAREAIRNDRTKTALGYLGRAPKELRGWEWNHLLRAADQSRETLGPYDKWIQAIAASPDGGLLAVSTVLGNFEIRDLRSGEVLLEVESTRNERVRAIAFDEDGARIVTGSENGVVEVREVERLDTVREVCTHTQRVRAVDFIDAADAVLSCGADGVVMVRDMDGGSGGFDLPLGVEPSRCVLGLDSPRYAVCAAERRAIYFGRVDDAGVAASVLRLDAPARAITLDGAGTRIAIGYESGRLEVRDLLSSGTVELVRRGPPVSALAFDRSGARLAAAASGPRIKVWDTSTRRPIHELRGHEGIVTDLLFSGPDEGSLLSGARDSTIKCWNVDLPTHTAWSNHDQLVKVLAFSRDGRLLASGDGKRGVVVRDVFTREIVADFRRPDDIKDPTEFIAAIAFDAAGTRMYFGFEGRAGYEENLEIWDVGSASRIDGPTLALDNIRSIHFDASGARFVVGTMEDEVALADTARPDRAKIRIGHEDQVQAVAFSPNGSTFLSASWDHTIKLWDAARGEPIRTLRGHTDRVEDATFLPPDGNRIVSASSDSTLRVWDVATGATLRVLDGHQAAVKCVAVNPDGTRIVSGSDDKSMKIWDPDQDVELLTIDHPNLVMCVEFSPDGTLIASGGADGYVRLFDSVGVAERAGQRVGGSE